MRWASNAADVFPPTSGRFYTAEFVEFHPLSSLSPSAPIEFTISGGGAECLDFSNTYLHVRAKITRANGVALADTTDVASVNYWLHTLFSQVDVSLNTTGIVFHQRETRTHRVGVWEGLQP